jgi:hypothetical protein
MDVRPAAFNETVIVINGFSTTFPLVATFYCFFSPFYLYPLGGEKVEIFGFIFFVCTKLSKLMEFLVCWVHGRGQSDLSASLPVALSELIRRRQRPIRRIPSLKTIDCFLLLVAVVVDCHCGASFAFKTLMVDFFVLNIGALQE